MMRMWPHKACAAMKESFDVFRTFLDYSLPDEELLSMYYISLYTEESMIFIQNLIADGGILKPHDTYHYGDDWMQIYGRTVVNILILRNLLDGDVEQNAVSMGKFVRQLVLFNVEVSRKVETIIRSGDRFSCSPNEKQVVAGGNATIVIENNKMIKKKKNSTCRGNSSGNTLRDCKKMTTILDTNSQSSTHSANSDDFL
nr:hypothetical protein [Tanacetum cinerariifolium]